MRVRDQMSYGDFMNSENTMASNPDATSTRAGWRIAEFCRLAGIGRSTLYALPMDRQPLRVKLGRSTIIVEGPDAWLRRVGMGATRA
jgi:hypothetical protein